MRLLDRYDKLHLPSFRALNIRRLRHWRGHGVHSPFVYNMVRTAFMSRKVNGEDFSLYTQLCSRRMAGRRTSATLQNMFTYCGYSKALFISDGELPENINHSLIIFDKEDSLELIQQTIAAIGEQQHCAIMIMNPHKDRLRHKKCNSLVESHKGVSIDKRSSLILFFDKTYRKQHYKL